MKTEDLGRMAAAQARKALLSECSKTGLTARKTFLRIAQGLDAKETKATYDKERGKWSYSKPMIAWGARKDYAALAVVVLDLKPSERVDMNVSSDLPERLFEARERALRICTLLERARLRMEAEQLALPSNTEEGNHAENPNL